MSIAIEVGTSKACIGIEKARNINLVKNILGEEIIPSVVSIKDKKILAGIDADFSKISNYQNTISEVKRLIGKNFSKDDKSYQNYKKYLSYELIEEENKPILIKIEDSVYNPEEIYAYIIKKLMENGELFSKKAVITIPSCFGLIKRKLIQKAAKLAGIEGQIINESYASALAFEININKNKQEFNYDYNYDVFLGENKNKINENFPSSPVSIINNTNKLTIIFDLGGGCFDLTLLSIEQKDNKFNFEIKANLGDPNFGCIDFDNKLVDYCVKEFCNRMKIDEANIYKDKKAIKRLKYRCEIAKKILSNSENAIINVDDFFNNEHLCSNITRDLFDEICDDLYKKIINKIEKLFKQCKISINDINEVLVIGGATKIPKILKIFIDKFSRQRVIYNLDKDKIVICGAVLYASEMKKKTKNIILKDTIPLSIGISIVNKDLKSFLKHGNKMYKIIKQNSKIPISVKRMFKTIIGENRNINLDFFEGENKYAKYNQKICNYKLEIPSDAEEGSIIFFNVNIEIDKNYNLKIIIEIPSFKITKEIEIENYDKNEKKKILKISNEIKYDFAQTKKELFEYKMNIENNQGENKNKILINCCNCCENILNEYENNYIQEDILENIFITTRDLFLFYLQRLKLTNKKENDNYDIILKIKEKMKNMIKSMGYVEALLDIFKDIYTTDKNIYFEIMINYMEIMNNEGVYLLIKSNLSKKYYSKIYFKSCALVIKNIEKLDYSEINEELKHKFEIQKKINECSLDYINTREIQNKSFNFKSLKYIVNSINNKPYKWLKDTLSIINDLENNMNL